MRKYHFWAQEDRELLSRLYPVTPSRTIAHQFGVSEASVRQVAHRMGLVKAREIRGVSATACSAPSPPRTHRSGSPAVTRLCGMLELMASLPHVDRRGLRTAVRTAIELAREEP